MMFGGMVGAGAMFGCGVGAVVAGSGHGGTSTGAGASTVSTASTVPSMPWTPGRGGWNFVGSHAGLSAGGGTAVGLLGEPVRWGAPATPGRRSRRRSGAASAMSLVSEGNTPPTKSRLRVWRRRSGDRTLVAAAAGLRSPPSRFGRRGAAASRDRSRSPSRRASAAVRDLDLGGRRGRASLGRDDDDDDGADDGDDLPTFDRGFFVLGGDDGVGWGGALEGECKADAAERQRRRTEAARASERRRRKLARAEKRRGLSPGALRATERYNQGAQVPRDGAASDAPEDAVPASAGAAPSVRAPRAAAVPAAAAHRQRDGARALRKEAMPFRPPMRAFAVAVPAFAAHAATARRA